MANLEFGTKLWLSLVGVILFGDLYALWEGKETFTEALARAMLHPRKRWLVVLAWAFTTKHLFFGRVLKWVDPFALMALGIGIIRKTLFRGQDARFAS